MLTIDDLTRRYGDRAVVDGISFDVRPGELVGFVGANGSGKTTTMRMIFGVLAVHGGEVLWHGEPVTAAIRQRFGYMPEERGLYPSSASATSCRSSVASPAWTGGPPGPGRGRCSRRSVWSTPPTHRWSRSPWATSSGCRWPPR